MRYIELKTEHQKRVDALPIQFAFSQEQFEEGMKNLGLTVNDKDKVVSIGCGGFIRKSDVKLFHETMVNNSLEMEKALNDDEFCIDAIKYELDNYEYGYTRDPTDALEALGLSIEDNRVRRLFDIVVRDYYTEE